MLDINDLLARLEGAWDSWSDEEKDLAKRAAKDYATLTAQQLAGSNPNLAQELAVLEATLSNVSAAVAATLRQAFFDWITELAGQLIDAVFPTPGG